MKLGLISDVHASPAALQQALQWFEQQQVDRILCAGDIAGYFDALDETVALLQQYQCECIIGNHDQHYLQTHAELADSESYRFLQSLPARLQFECEGLRVLMVHAHPPQELHGGIKLLDENGERIPAQLALWQQQLQGLDADILIVGHTHQVFVEQLGEVLVINPGSAPFNHSCMLLQLPQKQVETHALQGKTILPTWNWGMFVRQM